MKMHLPGDEATTIVVPLLMPTSAGHQIRHAKQETDRQRSLLFHGVSKPQPHFFYFFQFLFRFLSSVTTTNLSLAQWSLLHWVTAPPLLSSSSTALLDALLHDPMAGLVRFQGLFSIAERVRNQRKREERERWK